MVSLNLQTGLAFPGLRRGTRGYSRTIRGSHSSASSGCQRGEPIRILDTGATMLFSTLDQLFIPARIFQSAWEFAQAVYLCFVDFEKAIIGKGLFCTVRLGFFVQNRRVLVVDGLHFGGLRILSLLFAVFLLASSSGGLLLALKQCTVRQCEAAGMKGYPRPRP